MTAAEQRQPEPPPAALAALFSAFLTVSLFGIGGGGGVVWSHRVAVEKRRWISDREFTDILSLCQFMPGPNVAGIAVCVGTRLRGALGALAALGGFLIVPGAVGFALGLFWLEHAQLPVLRNMLGGIAATAAGLPVATGIRLLVPHRRRPAALVFAGLAFGLITLAKLPLLAVLLGLAPLSMAAAGVAAARR